MDHKWGRNVVAYGLGSLGATLAARDLSFPFARLYVTNVTDGFQYLTVGKPLDTGSHFPWWFNWSSTLGENFPYRRAVEPDGPV